MGAARRKHQGCHAYGCPPGDWRAWRGVAAELVERLVADARDEGFKIVPQCSYVAAKFADNPDWHDLRAD